MRSNAARWVWARIGRSFVVKSHGYFLIIISIVVLTGSYRNELRVRRYNLCLWRLERRSNKIVNSAQSVKRWNPSLSKRGLRFEPRPSKFWGREIFREPRFPLSRHSSSFSVLFFLSKHVTTNQPWREWVPSISIRPLPSSAVHHHHQRFPHSRSHPSLPFSQCGVFVGSPDFRVTPYRFPFLNFSYFGLWSVFNIWVLGIVSAPVCVRVCFFFFFFLCRDLCTV